ncbi:MAG: histidine kinase [Provencibacterium sp.]|jgi:two-component system sensor histidine kinase YesM|nr:histidine kinase [Provencibacterium sp.]
MKRQRSRLFTTLVISFILVGVLPVLAAGALISEQSGRLFMQSAMPESGEAAEIMSNALAVRLREYRMITDALASLEPAVRWAKSGENAAEMRELIRKHATEVWNRNMERVYIHLFSKSGGQRLSTGSIPNLYNLSTYGSYGIFRKAAEFPGETVAFANHFSNHNGEKICLSLCRALVEEGEVAGFVVVDVLRQDLMNLLRSTQPASTELTLLLDERGMVVLSSESEEMEGKLLQDARCLQKLSALGAEGQMLFGENSLCSCLGLWPGSLWLFNTVTFFSLQRNAEMIAAVTLSVGLVAVLAAAALGTLLACRVGQPVQRLIQVFEYTKKGDFDHRFALRKGDWREIEQLATHYNDMVEEVNRLMENNLEKQRRLNIAELNALESQIKPHFFYNILNDIKSLSKLGRCEDISRLVVAFGKVLRGSMAGGEEYTDIAADLEWIESYLEMQNIRHDYTIHRRIEAQPDILEEEIPRFILQPIVENAVVHGLEKRERGFILIRAWGEGEDLFFEITDNGTGFEPHGGGSVPESRETGSLHHGIGLANIDRRLQLAYGEGYGITVRSRLQYYTQVTIKLRRKPGKIM